MIMDMTAKSFEVQNVEVSELEGYLNDLAEEGRTLYNVYGDGLRFTVISYAPHDWNALVTEKWASELQSEKESAKHWAAKLAEKSGGHSNE